MIKCRVIKEFSLENFDKLVDIKRKNIDKYGKLFVGDTFKCDKDMVEYLTRKNDKNAIVVKIIELETEKKNKE